LKVKSEEGRSLGHRAWREEVTERKGEDWVTERLRETCHGLENLAESGKERLRFEWFVW